MLYLLAEGQTVNLPGATIVISLVCAIIGLIIFLAAHTRPDLKRIGEIMFFCGLLAFLLTPWK